MKLCSRGTAGAATYQPPLERDGVDAEVSDQAEVVVHVLQAAQHLRAQEEQRVVNSMRAARPYRPGRGPQGKPGSFSRPVPRGQPSLARVPGE